MNNRIVQLSGALLLLACLILPQAVFAGAGDTPTLGTLGQVLGTATLSQLIVRIIQIILAFLGLAAIAYLMYGGFIWQTAGGDESKVAKAKAILIQTIIGLVIIFSSYAISAFLFNRFAPPQFASCDASIDPDCGASCDAAVQPVKDCSVGLCPGTRTCIPSTSLWSGCSLNSACSALRQYADLTGWKSDSLNLQRNALSSANNAINNLPDVSDLQIRGMAKNQGGVFSDLSLFWGVSANPMNYSSASSSAFAAVYAGKESIENVFAPLDATLLGKSTLYKMRLTAKTSGSDINSLSFQFKIRPQHCFNGSIDGAQGETGTDCGGECGSCDGDSCSKTPETCSADSSRCSSGICSQADCLCVALPALFRVSPARDINNNNDNHTAEYYSEDVSSGAPGNIITLQGRNFGAKPGEVWFRLRGGSAAIRAELASDCAVPAGCKNAASQTYWTNNQIIAKVPPGIMVDNADEASVTSATANYEVFVVSSDNLSSLNNSNALFRSRLFEIDKIDRPGICNICPSSASAKAPITISGFKFPALDGRVVWNFTAYNQADKAWRLSNVTSTGSSWNAGAAADIVPENRSGYSGVRVFNGTAYSNYYNFLISAGKVGDPCGFDSAVCNQDLTTCQSGLECSKSSCKCVDKAAVRCVAGETCDNGGCSGKKICPSSGGAVCVLNDPKCVPFLGSAAGRAIFSWAFSAYKKPTAGMSCASDLWGDGTCDINGCLDSSLSCDTKANAEEWIELYNPLSSDLSLSGWHLVYGGNSAKISYDSTLSADQNASKYSLMSLDLSGITIAKQSYYLINKAQFGRLVLPKRFSSYFLVDGQNRIVDSVGYGDNGLAPAYSPASIGRKIDGLHTGTSTDFSYFSNSSPLSANNPSKSTSSAAVSINEISLGHDACTCVPKAQMCQAGATDAKSCAPIGQCKAVRKCDSAGHWGSCIQENSACIPYITVPSSTIAVYAWNFGVGSAVSGAGPKVVTACGNLSNCQNQLPSPTPWDYKWNADSIKGISNAKACLNAVISARFDAAMDASSLNAGNIKLYKSDSRGSWTDVGSSIIDSITTDSSKEAGTDYFKINLKSDLAEGASYRVVLLKDIQDELGRKLIDDNNGVNGSDCDGDGITSAAKVCWDFTTRSGGSDLYCPIGCINCSPTRYFNRYYGQERRHAMTPISRDNVCMMLDARRYDWQWYEEEQKNAASDYLPSKATTSDYWFIENGSSAFDYYSMMTAPQSGGDGIADQSSGSDSSGRGTTTAETESNFKANEYGNDWFTSEDDSYFRITGKIKSSRQTGSCMAQNNFTDPVVIENQFCSKSSSTALRIMQSPSPWKNQQDACINSDMFLLFSRNMLNSSLLQIADNSLATEGKLKNIDIYACGNNAAAATSSEYSVPSGCVKQNGWTGRIFRYARPNLTMKQLMEAQNSESTTTEGIMILPPGGQRFDENKYYKVVVRGGKAGVRGGERNGNTEAPIGVLQVPSANALMTNPADNMPSYYWYFKTGVGLCQIDQVNVHPQIAFMSKLGQTEQYDADPTAANCNHLNPDSYNWSWKSLLDPKDNEQLCGANGKSGDGVATICGSGDTSCASTLANLKSPVAKAFGHLDGLTEITARADNSAAGTDRCTDKWGNGDLKVGYGGFTVIGSSNTDCQNSEISFKFSQDAKNASAVTPRRNILLYECKAGDALCLISNATAVSDFSIKTPKGLNNAPYNPVPAEGSAYVLSADLVAGKTYRVVILGGDNGIKSKYGSKLDALNFSTANTAVKDSYSWKFSISGTAQICRYVGIGLNPCPNGVWNVTAAADTKNLTVKLYKGSDVSGANCISDAQMRNLGFWRAALEHFVKLIKMFFGNRSAMAADYWCLISDENFAESDLARMRLGDFKRETVIDGSAASLSAYSESDNGFKINIIRQNNWNKKTEYKAVVLYERNGIFGTSTDQVLTNAAICKINSVRFDVWPRGAGRSSDSFFCASDPLSGKADECGRFSAQPEDDDMSAVWTKDFPDNGYNICADGSSSNALCAAYKSGNNHLYRLWALSGNYTVRGNFSADSNKVINITGTQTAGAKISASGLIDNAFFVTSGANPGRSIFRAFAYDRQDASVGAADKAGTTNKELPIFTYFCANPWPDATNFPFIDSSKNCTAAGTCLNTNFGSYYCRDAGIEKTCVHGDASRLGRVCGSSKDCFSDQSKVIDGSCLLYSYDDLPSIGNYNAVTGKFGANSGVVTGTYGDSCNNLPASFKAVAGYKSRDGKSYVWNNSGSVYASSNGEWEEINKGAWAVKGLPGSFKPVFAYAQTRAGVTYDVLFSSTEIYYFDGSTWKKDTALASALPKGFWPIMGAINPANNTSLYLANSAGQLVIVPYNSDGSINSGAITNPALIKVGALAVRPKLMQSAGGGIAIFDYSNNLYLRGSGDWVKQNVSNLPKTLAPVFTSALSESEFTAWMEPKGYIFRHDNGIYWSVAEMAGLNNVVCDNKIKDFLFAGIVSSAASPISISGDASARVQSGGFVSVGSQQATDDKSAIRLNNGGLRYSVNVPSSGKYYISLETTNGDTVGSELSKTLPIGFTGSYGTCLQGSNLRGNVFYHSISVDVDGSGLSEMTAIASDLSSHQYTQTPVTYDLSAGSHTINVAFNNDCYCPASDSAKCAYGTADPNLRLYSVKLVPASSAASDAIGIRVYNNSSHLSPTAWYKARFIGQAIGALQRIIVDGYQAVTEGTTAYINASDFGDRPAAGSASAVYTDVYVMSYNQGASESTQKIYSQMLGNAFFNAGKVESGGLDDSALGFCSVGAASDDNLCFSDIDCEKRNAGYCDSAKSKITRDTKRISDVQEIFSLLGNYYGKLRCSNDFSRSCNVNADCYGGGSCGNFKPRLSSGSYIVGQTNSAWPSWQENLGKDLGAVLPVDPINKIFAMDNAGQAVACSEPYNSVTCWDAKNKTLPVVNSYGTPSCNISGKTSVYLYYGSRYDANSKVYAMGELYPKGENWQPDWSRIPNLSYNPFFDRINNQDPYGGYPYTALGMCFALKDTCGNGIAGQDGENCSTCPLDNGCGAGQRCQKNSNGTWSCANMSSCGDGTLQPGEQCDLGPFNTIIGNGCTPITCQVASGWQYNENGVLSPFCGDGRKLGSEQCDFFGGAPSIGCTASGCCNLPGSENQCKFSDKYVRELACSINAFTVNGVPVENGSSMSVTTADDVTIAWNVSGNSPTARVSASGISGVDGNTSLNYSQTMKLSTDKTVTLTACGENRTMYISVTAPAAVCRVALTADSQNVTVGQSTNLRWSSEGASSLILSGGMYANTSLTPLASGYIYTGFLTSPGNYAYSVVANCGAVSQTAQVTVVASASATAYCGDGTKNGAELCDCGDSAHTGSTSGFDCYVDGNHYINSSLVPESTLPWRLAATNFVFCNGSCNGSVNKTGLYCGDGILTSAKEQCDKLNDVCCNANCSGRIISGSNNAGTGYCNNAGNSCAAGQTLNASGVCVGGCDNNGVCSNGETVATCPADCRCGNGVVDAGEACDCTASNGTANTALEQPWKNQSLVYNKTCKTVNGTAISNSIYSTSEQHYYSCASDCRSYSYVVGPFCGDGIYQPEGEICDTGINNNDDRTRYGCSSQCRSNNNSLWWWGSCHDSRYNDGTALKCWQDTVTGLGEGWKPE